MELTKDVVMDLIAHGRAMGKPVEPGATEHQFIVIPAGYKAEDISAFLPLPRIKQSVVMLEAASFADYVNRYKSEQTLIFVEVSDTGAKFLAVLDYHGQAPALKPQRCAHTVTYATSPTKEWSDWMAFNAKAMDQVKFASWLEDNYLLIQAPDGAELMELIQNLDGKSDVRFNSAIRLNSGAHKLQYDEDVVLKGNVTSKEGMVELPKEINAGISPFLGAAPYEVKARLKYRIEGKKLAIWYETITPHRIVRDAVSLVTKTISEKTDLIPFIGRP